MSRRTSDQMSVKLELHRHSSIYERFMADARLRFSRYRNWDLGIRTTDVRLAGEYRIISKGSNSDWRKKSTFRRGLEVFCVARLDQADERSVSILIANDDPVTVRLPRGYGWDIDHAGLTLVSGWSAIRDRVKIITQNRMNSCRTVRVASWSND